MNEAMNYYDQMLAQGAIMNGAALVQAEGQIGGQRYVFAGLEALLKNAFVHPPIGGLLKNPFRGPAKIYAGDLIEHDLGIVSGKGATIKILKAYGIAKNTDTESDTVIYIKRDGYVHIPFVGDNIMVGQADFKTKAVGVTITAVEVATLVDEGDAWKVTLSATLGTLTKGTVLVEAAEAGSKVLPMVTNPNCFAPNDYDFALYDIGGDEYHKPRYNVNFCMLNSDVVMWKDKMGPIAPAVLAMNKSTYPEFWRI